MIEPWAFLILALGVYRLSRLIVEDEIFSPVRDRIWDKFPPERTRIGYFFTCYWCSGLWFSAILVLLYFLVPPVAMTIATVLAVSTVVGLIQHWLER